MSGTMNLLSLLDVVNVVEGRKKLQKIVHILQCQGHDFPQHFGYLHFGPYSSEVAAEVESLVHAELLVEHAPESQFCSYKYAISEEGKSFVERFVPKASSDKWMALAQVLNQADAKLLEAVSTLLYLQAKQTESLEAQFCELKPQLAALFDRAQMFIKENQLLAQPNQQSRNNFLN